MVQVVLRMVARPHRMAGMVQTLRALMLPLRAAPGLVSCHLHVDADAPDRLCYVEEWQSSQDLDQQIRSSHYMRLLALMEEAAEPPDLCLHWVSATRGMDYLEEVRLGGS